MITFNIKLVKNNNSYISVAKIFKIPCSYDGSRYYRLFNIFGFRLTVVYCDIEGTIYIYPFLNSKFNIRLKIKNNSMKARHYKDLIINNFDEEYIEQEVNKIAYKKLKYKIDFYNPKTFNEKIIWIKLFDKNPLISICCDKYRVKKYVSETIGKQYILPVLKAWDDYYDVDFDNLPEKFVIKVNWSSGYNIIVKDKTKFNKHAALKIIEKWMKPESNSYYHFFNYGYKDIKPKVYIEPYIEEKDGQLNDYKLFINNGKLVFVLMATDRFGEENGSLSYYDANLKKFPLSRGNKNNKDIKRPEHFDLMVDLAIKLAKPFKFVRVDFYEDNHHNVYVGEMTFYTAGGLTKFNPQEWDRRLGDLIELK